HIAAQGVDLSVVRNVAIGMGKWPGRKRVCREALMHEAERAYDVGILQLGIEIGYLRRQQQAFINDRARGERRDIKEVFILDIALGHFGLGALADDVELSLELILGHALGTAYEDLLDVRLRVTGDAADG